MTRTELLQIAKPVLFNTEMVRAILDERKTETRRVVKPQPQAERPVYCYAGSNDKNIGRWYDKSGRWWTPPCHAGDVLYVRETWRSTGAISQPYAYRASEDDLCLIGESGDVLALKYRWRPSIHMPKDAARLFLQVTGVRIERLQDIDVDGARAEGCDGRCECPSSGAPGSLSCVTRDFSVEKFETVWDSTIKPADIPLYGWAANPLVWVIEFERMEVH